MRKSLTPELSAPSSKPSTGRGIRFHEPASRHGASPREFVIRNLMNYSRSLSVLAAPQTGVMTAVMN